MVIRVMSSRQLSATSANFYLIALALSDSCVLVFNFMIGVLRGMNPNTTNAMFQNNEWLCLIHSVVVELFNLLSVWIIVCFTVERFTAVFAPLKTSKLYTIRGAKVTVTILCLFILLIALHKFFVTGFEGDSVFGYKACKTSRHGVTGLIYVYVAINTWFPAVIIIMFNLLITVQIHNKFLRHQEIPSREVRITRTLMKVSAVYIILLLPLGITQTVELWWNNSHNISELEPYVSKLPAYIHAKKISLILKQIRSICFFFYQLNFGINIFIYLLNSSKFTKVFKQLFPCVFSHRLGRNPTPNLGPVSSAQSIKSTRTSKTPRYRSSDESESLPPVQLISREPKRTCGVK